MLKLPTLTANSPTIAEVDLAAFKENIRTFKQVAADSMLMAVIKTNAYGHGTVPIGLAAVEAGADRLGVTTVEEGALLRENGITVPVHILSSVLPEQAADIVTYDLTASVSSRKLANDINNEAKKQHKTVPVNLKIDTGLHRFGIEPKKAIQFCESCYHLTSLNWEGIYTHFPNSDEGDWELTEEQFALFLDTVSNLNDHGYNFPIRHVGASTIAIERKDMHLDMIRPGAALFGYEPASRQRDLISLRPVMTLKSRLLSVRELPPNTPVGYGGSYVTSSHEKIAIVPIGHGDGYKYALSNKGEMLVNGKRARIVGTISLDQTVINVTGIPDVRAGDEVIVMGSQGGDEISAKDIAEWMESNVDEVLSSLMERIRRVYV
ncbi:alanine racemase [Virgibacillus doumboii]|uniref:alanine racemase n=1 Tax=Virgibacillus doumboii TaxID=2697503 RepID=UPI0013DF3191|nr:alanine racemase [Virgibacillus doumboii]